jgi:hypothetical protein
MPRESLGMYWGYTTRLAENLTAAINECPFEVSWMVTKMDIYFYLILLKFIGGCVGTDGGRVSTSGWF